MRRNSARAWPSSTVDLRASWRRAFGRMTVEGIVEAFNVLNHTNRRIPNNIVGAGATPPAAFGLATAADDPRQVQLGVRLGF